MLLMQATSGIQEVARMFRTVLKVAVVLSFVSLGPVVLAQQNTAGSDPKVSAAPSVSAVQPAATATTLATADTPATDARGSKPILRELSPWSMFMSADIIVKAVMIGLAFASLVTWTVFIAKMVELTVIQRTLRAALRKIADARSL